jgi:hypothetical protein
LYFPHRSTRAPHASYDPGAPRHHEQPR